MMKNGYMAPDCAVLPAGVPNALCTSDAFTDDYSGYDPWNDLVE